MFTENTRMSEDKNNWKEPTDPMDLGYMKLVRLFLSFLEAWPYTTFGQKKYVLPFRKRRFIIVLSGLCLIGGILYIKDNFKGLSFFKLGQTYLTVFMNVICFQRLMMPWFKTYIDVVKDFVLKMHLFHHKNKNEYSLQVSNRVDNICKYYSRYLILQVLISEIFYNITPLYYNYRHGMFSKNRPVNGTFEHSVYYSLPFDYTTKFSGYLVIAIFNAVMSFDCGSLFCIFDLWLSIIVFHIWGHLKILNYNLTHFPKPAPLRETPDEIPFKYSEEESIRVTDMLKDNINHHRLIKDFMTQTSTAYGTMLCIYYAFHMVSGCVLLLECSAMDTESLGRYGFLTLVMFQQLIQVSVVFELLGSESELLTDSVYSMPWECMDIRNRKICLFYFCNVQAPLRLKALGVVPVGVQTMAGILKTSFSYFMLLRTAASEGVK